MATSHPVTPIETDPADREPEPGIALCLSGGGYRAMVFHLGVLWRLNDAGLLPQLDRISSVSGGSITAAALGLKWPRLQFDGNHVAKNLIAEVITPVRKLAAKTIDEGSILVGMFSFGATIGEKIEGAYRKYLFGNATLQQLPDRPRFVINATNVQSGVLWRFMKPYMRDYRVGKFESPPIPLAQAVAASSAFPPVLSPVRLELEHDTIHARHGTGPPARAIHNRRRPHRRRGL